MADPLEAVLRPVANLLNRNIAESTPARNVCARLDGRTVAVRVHDTALAMYFCFDDGVVSLASDFVEEPDVLISGSLITLARLAGPNGEEVLHEGGVELTGNAGAARAFQDLLGHAKPDIEEELSAFVGDVAAHRLGEIARGVGRWARGARSTMRDNIREYLQEEARDVPSRYEVERFTGRVDTLRDDVERLEARLRRLEGEN